MDLEFLADEVFQEARKRPDLAHLEYEDVQGVLLLASSKLEEKAHRITIEDIAELARIIADASLNVRMATGKAQEIVIMGDIEYHAKEILKLIDEVKGVEA